MQATQYTANAVIVAQREQGGGSVLNYGKAFFLAQGAGERQLCSQKTTFCPKTTWPPSLS
jgi:hypothetical protein